MFNSPYMTSSVDYPERSFIEQRVRQSPSPTNTDPWCLICRTNLKTEDLPYKYIFDERLPLDGLIESLLGLELDKTLPSAYLCFKCEKELQRMSWQDDSSARGDMLSKLESNLHQWPPRSSLSAPGEEEGGTVSAISKNTTTTSDPRHLFFTKDAVSSLTFENLEESSASSGSVTMASRGRIYQKEDGQKIQTQSVEQEKEERNGEEVEEEEEEEVTLDDTTTYILYSSPTGALETRLLSHESSWSPSRKRKEDKSRSSSRHSSGDSEKHSRLESNSFSQDITFEDQLSVSAPKRLNKTDLSSSQYTSSKEFVVPDRQNREMTIPESCGTGTSSVMTTTRLWAPSEKQEQNDTLGDEDEEDSRESEEDAVTTTTTTTTTTTMTTPKGTTQWTKTRIKTIWDDADEEEEMEEVAVEVATPSTSLPSSTEAAVAAASAATKKAFSHSPDTRRRRRENRHSSKERIEEKNKNDKAGKWSEDTEKEYRGSGFDMDTSTKTTQYYDSSRMDSGRPKSFQLTGDHLGNVYLYRGNYGDVNRDLADRVTEERTASSKVDMQYMSQDYNQDRQSFHRDLDFSFDKREEKIASSEVDIQYMKPDNNQDIQSFHKDPNFSLDEREDIIVSSDVDMKYVSPDNDQDEQFFHRDPVFSYDQKENKIVSNDVDMKYMISDNDQDKQFFHSCPDFYDDDRPQREDVQIQYYGDSNENYEQGDDYYTKKKEEEVIVNYEEKKEEEMEINEKEERGGYNPYYPSLREVKEERNMEREKENEERILYYPDRNEEKEERYIAEEKSVIFPGQFVEEEKSKEEEMIESYPSLYEEKKERSECYPIQHEEEGERREDEKSMFYPDQYEEKEKGKEEEMIENYPSLYEEKKERSECYPIQHEEEGERREGEKSVFYSDQYGEKEKSREKERSQYYPDQFGEKEEERNRKKETSGYNPYPSQHYEQDIDVCRTFPYLSPDQQTINYRNDGEVKGGEQVDDGFRLNEVQKETIINSSVAGLGYQSTEFSSGYPPYSYPDNRGENAREHWSTTAATTDSYVGVDKGQMQKDEVRATTIRRTDSELTTYPAYPTENSSNSKDSDPARLALTSDTKLRSGKGEENSHKEMYSGDQGSSPGSSKKYGGGQRGGNEDPKGSGTSSPSHLRRQGSKDSRSSGRHRKRRHRGRNRDRSRDSEASNDSSSGSNPVVQTHEEVGGSAKEFVRTQQDNQKRKVEVGDGATAIAACVEQKEEEEAVRPSEEWDEKEEGTMSGAISGHLWTTTAADGIDTEGKGGCTPSPETDHSPPVELPYTLDYRRSYYDNDTGGGEGKNNNNNNNNNEEEKIDEDNNNNNNNSNNSNNEFCNSVERETTRIAEIDTAIGTSRHDDILEEADPVSNNLSDNDDHQEQLGATEIAGIETAIGTSTHDDILEETYPASYNQSDNDDHQQQQQEQQQSNSADSNIALFSAPNYGQTSDLTESSSNLENQHLSSFENQQLSSESQSFLETQQSPPPSSNRWDYATQVVYNAQDSDYISSTSYNLQQQGAPYAYNSSLIMDSQDETTNGDTGAICTDNPATDNDFNVDITADNYEFSNDPSTNDYPNNMDSKQGEFDGDFNGDANLTQTTSDAQWTEPNKDSSPNVNLNDSKPFRDDYESYHTEFAYAGGDTSGGDMTECDTSGGNVDYNSGFNADEDENKMEPTMAEDSEEVTDFEEAPSAGAWAGYKEGGTSDEQMPSLNDEIAQADQNPNWNDSFDGGQDEEGDDGQKADWSEDMETTERKEDAWSPNGSGPHQDNVDGDDDANRDNDMDVDNGKVDGQLDDTGGFDDDYNQDYQNDDTVENTEVEVEEVKDFNDTDDGEHDQVESRQDDSAEIDNYALPQDDTENYSSHCDDRPAGTGLVEDSQDYSGETGDYGLDENTIATYNMEESCHDTTIDTEGVIDKYEEQHDEVGEACVDPQEEVSDYKIEEEEEVDHKDDEVEYNMEESPVELGTSYTQDVSADNYGPSEQEDTGYADNYNMADNDNMADYDNQDGFGSHHEDDQGTGEFSWEMTQSAPESGAKRPMDLHLASTIYSETSPKAEQGVDYEEEPSQETGDANYVSPAREEIRNSPYGSPDQRQYGSEEIVAESPADRGKYWMDETTVSGTDQEGETLEEFQEDSVTATNMSSVHSAAVMEQTDTEAELMVNMEAIEECIISEVRSSIHTMYDGGRPMFDDSKYTSMYDSTNENLIPHDSRGPSWGSMGGNYESGVEVEGVIETRREIVEETLIVPTRRVGSGSYSYAYPSMRNNDMEDSEGHLRAPVAVEESSDDLGSTTFPSGHSEYSSVNDNLAATSVAGSFLDVPDNTEQKRWDSFGSSENKVPSIFGVAPHVERLRYGVMVRSGRAATSAGRKRDDQKPLIGSEWRPLDGKEFDDRDGDSGFWTPDTENDDNHDTDTMPFGFGKKKKNAALIEKEVSPPPPSFKEEENAEPIAEKVNEPAYTTEDATATDAEPVTVTQMVVEEETVVEMVTSDAVDGGTDQMVIETELVEGEKEEKGKTIEETEELATEMNGKDESTKEEVAMTEEPEVIEQVATEEIAMELVLGNNAAEDLAVTHEVMSIDLNELDDDDEVAILDRFEMLGQPAEPVPVETIAEKPVMETPAPVVEKQPKKQPRVESTPLIRKQPTKVKDTQPGFLCCTII